MGEFVLMKRGLYWRPDACGYTGVLAEAGRYTKEQAEARVDAFSKPSVTAHRVEDCAEFSPACWPETQIAVLRAENERLRADIDAYERTAQIIATLPPLLERVRHVKRGTEYEVLHECAEIQAGPDSPLTDYEVCVVYCSLTDGRVWVRRRSEFRDGRFVPSDETDAPAASE